MDIFNMNLAATFNRTVSELHSTIDILEYRKWFKFYQQTGFGPSVSNLQFGYLTQCVASVFGGDNKSVDHYQIGTGSPNGIKPISENMKYARRISKNVHDKALANGATKIEAEKAGAKAGRKWLDDKTKTDEVNNAIDK